MQAELIQTVSSLAGLKWRLLLTWRSSEAIAAVQKL